MPPITLINLPVEVHFEILKYALYLSQEAYYEGIYICLDGPDSEGPMKPDGWQWIEEDKANLSQFPYNVASVCRLWHAILAKIPECWTRVIIDVAFNTAESLEMFLWSKDLPKLEVTIFNSHTHASKNPDYSELERRRVSGIIDALLPHASRCKSITFDVIFLTSLPSPLVFLIEDAPYLEELVLECKIDNAGPPEEYSRTCDIGVRLPLPKTRPPFPRLRHLSMTGFWFMFIAGHPYTSEWFKTIRGNLDDDEITTRVGCCVSQFQFQTEGQYTLQNFVAQCSSSELKFNPLTLRDLSLDHDGPVLECQSYDEDAFTSEAVESLTFENITANVLQSLFFLADISPTYLTFDNCTFPDEILTTYASELFLLNIPYSPTDSADKRSTANLPNILQEFSGYSLSVVSCPSFDDSAFSALPGWENPTLQYLHFSDCTNVSVRGIQKFLERRNKRPTSTRVTQQASLTEPLNSLSIHGPLFPSAEDQKWFQKSVYARKTYVDWYRWNPENFGEVQRFSNRRATLS